MCTPGVSLPTSFARIPVFLVAKALHGKYGSPLEIPIPGQYTELITMECERQSFQSATPAPAIEQRVSPTPGFRRKSDEERAERQVLERGRAGILNAGFKVGTRRVWKRRRDQPATKVDPSSPSDP
jgi:hypothetical protein